MLPNIPELTLAAPAQGEVDPHLCYTLTSAATSAEASCPLTSLLQISSSRLRSY